MFDYRNTRVKKKQSGHYSIILNIFMNNYKINYVAVENNKQNLEDDVYLES